MTSLEQKSVSLSGTNCILGGLNSGMYYSKDLCNTFKQSNLQSDFYSPTYLLGSNGVTHKNNGTIYYTMDSGETWNPCIINLNVKNSDYLTGINDISYVNNNLKLSNTTILNKLNVLNTNIIVNASSFSFSGANGIAGSQTYLNNLTLGLLYTFDSGYTWYQSNQTNLEIVTVSLSGINGIASTKDFNLYYTKDSGINWLKSDIYNNENNSNYFTSVFLSGNNGVASAVSGIFYTEDCGKRWYKSSIDSGGYSEISSVFLCGPNGIACAINVGMLFTTDSGKNWKLSESFYRSKFTGGAYFLNCCLSGTNGIAGERYQGISYTSDSGKTWNKSNITNAYCISLTLVGNNGVALLDDGYYFTSDSGKTWKKSIQIL